MLAETTYDKYKAQLSVEADNSLYCPTPVGPNLLLGIRSNISCGGNPTHGGPAVGTVTNSGLVMSGHPKWIGRKYIFFIN